MRPIKRWAETAPSMVFANFCLMLAQRTTEFAQPAVDGLRSISLSNRAGRLEVRAVWIRLVIFPAICCIGLAVSRVDGALAE